MDIEDPTITDPELYRVVFENERVRVLEYRDTPGATTHLHRHPDSVMITLSAFARRVSAAGRQVDVEVPQGQVRWLDAQSHLGHNIGGSDTHALFVELKDVANERSSPSQVDSTSWDGAPSRSPLGPTAG